MRAFEKTKRESNEEVKFRGALSFLLSVLYIFCFPKSDISPAESNIARYARNDILFAFQAREANNTRTKSEYHEEGNSKKANRAWPVTQLGVSRQCGAFSFLFVKNA